jgi:hypothetical protein
MKPKILFLGVVGLMLVTLGSCYRDVTSPGSDPNGPPQAVSFSGDILPLFSKNCTTSGCHDAVPGHKPSLVPSNAYSALTSGGYVNALVPNQSTIYLVVKTGEMPPTGALKSSDVQKILDWIRNGAPNN